MTPVDTAFTPLIVPRVGETPADLRGEGDRARARGYAEGFAEGRRIALDEGRTQNADDQARRQQEHAQYVARCESALQAVRESAALFDQRADELAGLASARIEELAVDLATAILGVELSDPGRSASHALRRALAAMPVQRWTRVSFAPQDGAALREDADAAASLQGIEMIVDASVGAGGAIVEVADGAVDARITQALARAAAALRGDDDQPAGVLG
jgi:flagellar assembly protein FliH